MAARFGKVEGRIIQILDILRNGVFVAKTGITVISSILRDVV